MWHDQNLGKFPSSFRSMLRRWSLRSQCDPIPRMQETPPVHGELFQFCLLVYLVYKAINININDVTYLP